MSKTLCNISPSASAGGLNFPPATNVVGTRGYIGDRGASFLPSLLFICILALAVGLLGYTFGSIVPPGSVGVRQISFGPGQGFSKRALSPGYHWSIPFYSKIYLVPIKLQVVSLDRGLYRNEANGQPSLEVQTSDGNKVRVDVSILRSVFPEAGAKDGLEHGGAADLITNVGITTDKWDNQLVKVAEFSLKKTFRELSTSDFYNPHKREGAVNQAFAQMKEPLAKVGMQVQAVLLRRYTYVAQDIDDRIFKKNLQEQEEGFNAAASKFAEAEAALAAVEAEWEAKIATLRVEGQQEAEIIRSQAALYENEQRGSGDLEVAKARAEIDRQKVQALSQSEGAKIFIAREMAPLLASLKGGVVDDVDPYNLDIWMKKLGIAAK